MTVVPADSFQTNHVWLGPCGMVGSLCHKMADLIDGVIGWFRQHPDDPDLKALFTELVRQAVKGLASVYSAGFAHLTSASTCSSATFSSVRSSCRRRPECPQKYAGSLHRISLQVTCIYAMLMGMDDPNEPRSVRAAALATELRATLGKLKRRLREQAGVGELTPSQVSVLLRLEKDGAATASSLARAEGMRPQSMASVVAALGTAGLVSGAPDPKDGRQTLLSLTDACRKWVEEGRAARQDWLTRALAARLSHEELGEVAKAVALLRRLVDE